MRYPSYHFLIHFNVVTFLHLSFYLLVDIMRYLICVNALYNSTFCLKTAFYVSLYTSINKIVLIFHLNITIHCTTITTHYKIAHTRKTYFYRHCIATKPFYWWISWIIRQIKH